MRDYRMKKKAKSKTDIPRHEEWTAKEHTEVLELQSTGVPAEGRNAVKGSVKRGQAVVTDNSSTQLDEKLNPGDDVQIRERLASSSRELKGVNILHEDDDIIGIDKEN